MNLLIKYAAISLTLVFCNIGFAGQCKTPFVAVFDAGSTGTREHVYQCQESDSALPTFIDISQGLKTHQGLSDPNYVKEPALAAADLKPLFDDAKKSITEQHGDINNTPLYIYATAGMRLLHNNNPAAEKAIYKSILLTAQKDFPEAKAQTIPGEDEALYDWLVINQLTGKLGHHNDQTLGAMDMGGASTQIAFNLVKPNNNKNIREFKLAGVTYHLFNASFLGLGQDQVVEQLEKNSTLANCSPTGTPGVKNAHYDMKQCLAASQSIIANYDVKALIAEQAKQKSFIAFSPSRVIGTPLISLMLPIMLSLYKPFIVNCKNNVV